MCQSRYPKRIAITALALALVAGVQLDSSSRNNPHSPACVDAQCRKIMSFLKANYCGELPYGNGPKESCQIKSPKGPRPGVDVVTDFGCDWSDAKRAMDRKQQGEPPASFPPSSHRRIATAGTTRQRRRPDLFYDLEIDRVRLVPGCGGLPAPSWFRCGTLPSHRHYRPKLACARAAKGAIPEDEHGCVRDDAVVSDRPRGCGRGRANRRHPARRQLRRPLARSCQRGPAVSQDAVFWPRLLLVVRA